MRFVFTADDYGMFKEEDHTDIKKLMSTITHFKLTYLLRSTVPINNSNNLECFNWEITQNFDFTSRNHFIARLVMDKTYCSLDRPVIGNFWGRYIWLHLISIILSGVSLTLNIKYILNIVSSFNNMKEKFQLHKDKSNNQRYKKHIKKILLKNRSTVSPNSGFSARINASKLSQSPTDKYQPTMDFDNEEDIDLPDWSDLTNKDKLKLFSAWSLVTIMGDILLITGSLFLMLNTRTVSQKGEIILGLGAMLTWFSLLKFYQNLKGYNIIANTIENACEIVFKALTGIMPIFIGYGMLGTCIFWRSHRFSSFSTTMFSLFAVMNGDMIFDAWHDIDTVDFLLAQLYLYTFIFFAILVVLNTFIVIIEDGYVMQKFFARTDWVKGVNQRSSLHVAEMLMRQQALGEGGDNGGHDHGGAADEGAHGESSPQSPTKRKSSLMSEGTGAASKKLPIPMIHGAPIPHDGDPFVRIIKKSKKAVRSRKALIRMLRHEKIEILIERKRRKMSLSPSKSSIRKLPQDDGESSKEVELPNLIQESNTISSFTNILH